MEREYQVPHARAGLCTLHSALCTSPDTIPHMHWLTSWEFIWLFISEGALRVALAVHVILRRRPVTTSLAWLSIILFIPVAGLVFYFLIGEIRLGSRRAKKYEQLTKGIEE